MFVSASLNGIDASMGMFIPRFVGAAMCLRNNRATGIPPGFLARKHRPQFRWRESILNL